MTHETVDETLDRVAGEMTAVAGDPTLPARVRERMHRRPRPWLVPALVAASVAGVAALVVVTRPDGQSAGAEVHEVSGRALAPVAPFAGAVPQPDLSPTHFPVAAAAAIVSVDETPLVVAELVIAPLAMPEIAEVEPLRVASLEIAGIEFDESKEPR